MFLTAEEILTMLGYFASMRASSAQPQKPAEPVMSPAYADIFSNYSYASLKSESQAELERFLKSFYAGCKLMVSSTIPTDGSDLSVCKGQNTLIRVVSEQDDHKTVTTYHYVAFSEQGPQVTNIDLPDEAHHNAVSKLSFPEQPNTLKSATADELKHIRFIADDCMRFDTPAVLAIFEKRASRKEALSNSDRLLKQIVWDAIPLFDANQVDFYDRELRFAICQYLAQAQAAEDHIGVIRSPHTEKAKCYLKIKACTRLRRQLEIQQLALDIQLLEHHSELADTYKQKYAAHIASDHKELLQGMQSLKGTWLARNKEQQELEKQIKALNFEIKKKEWDEEVSGNVILSACRWLSSWVVAIEAASLETLDDLKASRDKAKTEYNALDAAVESLKPEPLASILPSFIKEDEDQYDSDLLLEELTAANGRRLFWVWNRCLIEALIIIAHQILLISTQILAWLSWPIYFLRGGISGSAAFWHAFDMFVSKREKVIAAHKRRLAHYQERRDEIFNDLIWGPINLACAGWLTGSGTLLGFIGDLLTALLLGMDLSLSFWRWYNGLSAHKEMAESYHKPLNDLLAKMSSDNEALDNEALTDILNQLKAANAELQNLHNMSQLDLILPWTRYQRIQALEAASQAVLHQLKRLDSRLLSELHLCQGGESKIQLNQLDQLRQHGQFLFKNQQHYMAKWLEQWATLYQDLIYAALLCVGFALMCFAPIPALSIAGAVLLGVSTVIWRTVVTFNTINHINREAEASETAYFALLDKFKALNASKVGEDESVQAHLDALMRQVYLEVRALGAESGYQREMAQFKQLELLRANILRIFVPVAIALTILFAPAMVAGAPAYVFLMLGVLVAAVLSARLLNMYKPQNSTWQAEEKAEESSTPCLVEAEYEAFKKSVLEPAIEERSQASSNPLSQVALQGLSLLNIGLAADTKESPLLEEEPLIPMKAEPAPSQTPGKALLKYMQVNRRCHLGHEMQTFSKLPVLQVS